MTIDASRRRRRGRCGLGSWRESLALHLAKMGRDGPCRGRHGVLRARAAAGFRDILRLAEREGLLGPSWASPLALLGARLSRSKFVPDKFVSGPSWALPLAVLGARFQRSRFAPCKSVEPVWVEGSNPSRESLRSTLFRRGRLVFGFLRLAEREGFEPSIRETRIPDFESGAFDHSATSPQITTTGVGQFPSGASVRLIPETCPSLLGAGIAGRPWSHWDEPAAHQATAARLLRAAAQWARNDTWGPR